VFFLAVIDSFRASNEEDLRLFERIVKRDELALSALYDKYSTLLFTVLVRIVRTEAEAEDLLQELFLRIWKKAGMFAASKGSVYTWIVTMARRKAIDRLRSKEHANRTSTIDEEEFYHIPDETLEASPIEVAMNGEYEQLMRSGLALLSEDQRRIIELSYFDGFTQQQISEQLNVPLGTVKTRMRQGIITLRDYLKERID
jgi:RNA polymerase sigma-70 factor (ECF subfamily)